MRKLLDVPPSKNPKALGLFLSAYCDLARLGCKTRAEAEGLKQEILRLRSPGERYFCWGYDWDYSSFRGSRFRAFSPNAVATVFCASALLDFDQTFGDMEARAAALSARDFFARRLNRSADTPAELCFSYTPDDWTQVYNSSALAAALLVRMQRYQSQEESADLANRAMRFLVNRQKPSGAWAYGSLHRQHWIDSFHTGYNLEALLSYERYTSSHEYASALGRGYTFYCDSFFTADGTPRYFHSQTYPVDIHVCAQAILTFCAFAELDAEALGRAVRIALWTIENMRNRDGSFQFQRHRLWVDRTPYMRWGQAWMFRALSRLWLQLDAERARPRN